MWSEETIGLPEDMRSNPDQTKTSRFFVCGGPDGCYFKP
jgi:hypothetical protein